MSKRKRQVVSLYMSAESHNELKPEPVAVHEPARRGSIILVLLVAAALVGAAVALMTLGRVHAQPYILGLLAVLAMVGLFNLFAFAAGIVRFADRNADNPIIGRIADHAYDGLAVTDPRGHVVYSNAAYLTLTGAASGQDVRPVERVFIGNPDVSEAVFRLLKAAREGKRQQEEVRIAGTEGGHGRWLRMRVRPLGDAKRTAKYAVWSIADITRDRERQEDVFQELQHAIEYLDHAPCGFFSVNPAGEVVYVNATLASWLDHDLAEIGSGGLKLTDIVSGDGASLLTSIVPAPGEVKTEVFDIDLRMRNGKTMPVRLYHKLAFGADGAPGASRTLVINRARDEHAIDPQRAAEVRFMRFFVQYRQWYERQKMTLQEMKEEYKQSEGDPHVKGRIRQLRAQRMKKRMMAAVPKASVIITNPTHYSVALAYDRGMAAPVCVAKGVDSLAFKIREIARQHDIPIVENVPLARSLYATVDIDEEIPVEHYHAVAEIIGFVMRLKRGFSSRN